KTTERTASANAGMASGTASTTGRPTVAEPAKPSAAAAKAAPAAAPRATRAQTDAAPRPARAARQGPSAVGTAAAGLRPRSRSARRLWGRRSRLDPDPLPPLGLAVGARLGVAAGQPVKRGPPPRGAGVRGVVRRHTQPLRHTAPPSAPRLVFPGHGVPPCRAVWAPPSPAVRAAGSSSLRSSLRAR